MRWYPTLISLADGRVLAASGLSEAGNALNETLEIFSPANNTWQLQNIVGNPGEFQGLPLYAHLFLLKDGRVFFSGGRMDDGRATVPCIINLAFNPAQTQPVPDLLEPDFRNQSASVLLPPAQDQKVMVIGGGPAGKPDKRDATDKVSIVDLNNANPVYLEGPPMCLARLHLNAVLLPDHTVFVSGGSLKQEDAPLARRQAELYDPATNSWRLMATASVARVYHSTAVLLPDGRVVAAGGNPEGGQSIPWEPPDPQEEMRLEIFSTLSIQRSASGHHRCAGAMELRSSHYDNLTRRGQHSLGKSDEERREHAFFRQWSTSGGFGHRLASRWINRCANYQQSQPRPTQPVHAIHR